MAGNTGFGSRVIGEEASAQETAISQSGANVFGTRVRDALQHETNAADAAKAVSEFGPRTVDGATATELSEEEIRKILDTATGNPTFLDSLYESELSRPGGPRQDVIRFMREVERGIKGQMRESVLRQMAAILGETSQNAEAVAAAGRAMLQRDQDMARRNEENLQLVQAPRAKALKERTENLQIVRDAESEDADLDATDHERELPNLADLTSRAAATQTGSGNAPAANAGPAAGTGNSTGSTNDSETESPEDKANREQLESVDTMLREDLEKEAARLQLTTDDGKGSLTDGSYSVDELRAKVTRAIRKEQKDKAAAATEEK